MCLQEMEIRRANMITADQYRSIKAPTLVIWTSHDPTATPEEGKQIADMNGLAGKTEKSFHEMESQINQREVFVKELVEKQELLPKDIRWHFIGHLQSNKVKYIAPFVYLIHGVDSFSLLKEINKQAQKNNRAIDCLLQIYIAQEETKFGLDFKEASEILNSAEFKDLKNKYENLSGKIKNFITYLNKKDFKKQPIE